MNLTGIEEFLSKEVKVNGKILLEAPLHKKMLQERITCRKVIRTEPGKFQRLGMMKATYQDHLKNSVISIPDKNIQQRKFDYKDKKFRSSASRLDPIGRLQKFKE